MANPFSAVPTAYRVPPDGRWWYANCAWDAFGILSALRSTAASSRHALTAASLMPRSRRTDGGSARSALSLPRPSGALVGRHHLHLKRDESLPVGGAHRALARRESRGQRSRRKSSATSRMHGGIRASTRLAAAHARRKPGDTRPARPHRPFLDACVASGPARRRTWLRRPRLLRRVESRRAASARPRRSLRPGRGRYVRRRRSSRCNSGRAPRAIRRGPVGRGRPRRRSGRAPER